MAWVGTPPKAARGAGLAQARRRALLDLLAGLGYAPNATGGELSLANCPYEPLSGQDRGLVCTMNLALVEGAVAGVGLRGADCSLRTPAVVCVACMSVPWPSIRSGEVDWAGWAIFGLIATAALTAVMIGAQLAGFTRLDLPLMLGTIVVADPDRARVAGFFIHLVNGQASPSATPRCSPPPARRHGGRAGCSACCTARWRCW